MPEKAKVRAKMMIVKVARQSLAKESESKSENKDDDLHCC